MRGLSQTVAITDASDESNTQAHCAEYRHFLANQRFYSVH